jgi:hypothetical protein
MDSALEVALVSASISSVVSVCVAVISPMFTHRLWKRQKRKEQQLAIAERFAVLFSEVVALENTSDLEQTSANELRFWSAQVEFRGLLYAIQVLFENSVITQRATDLWAGEDKVNLLICAELQAFLFAEALDIPTSKIPTRGYRKKSQLS